MAKKYKVGYQGERGAFSEIAAHQLLNDVEDMAKIELVPFQNFQVLFETLDHTELSGAVIPIENSLIGSVHESNVKNYELLLRYRPPILRETIVRVVHSLITCQGVDFSRIRRVYSHPMALYQCQRFLRAHAGQFEAIAYYDTAGSVKRITEENMVDAAAIASHLAAETYGAKMLLGNIGDNVENFTRFFLLGSRALHTKNEWRPQANKMSIVFGIKNRPGELVRCLNVFAARCINLTKIESQPIVGKPWEYLFYLDFMGNPRYAPIKGALEELQALSGFFQVLGYYDAAKDQ